MLGGDKLQAKPSRRSSLDTGLTSVRRPSALLVAQIRIASSVSRYEMRDDYAVRDFN
jgi:hypothetical protein